MNKPIEELIQRLKEPDYQYYGCELSKSEADMAISALEHQLANGWIPVAERLPEGTSQRVLVTLKNEMVLEVWYINNVFKYHEPLGTGGFEKVSDYNPVIAWRNLPQPYKEDTL